MYKRRRYEKKGKPKISDTKEQKRTIIIDVKGAVSKEGVYEMKEGDRVKDAVQKAGGFLSEVDMKKVNLAQIVQDQMLLYIPSKNESEQGVLTSSKEDGKIRINTAAKEQLEKINRDWLSKGRKYFEISRRTWSVSENRRFIRD